MDMHRNKNDGFTLVELLIVVIILAILAAIIIPQFSTATDDARLASLDTTLANIRSAIDLYHQQHEEYPGNLTSVGTACTTGDTGTGAEETLAAFMQQMTRYTDMAGESCTIAETGFVFGPYFKKDTLPPNPFTGSTTLTVVADGELGMTSSSTTGGWRYDTVTGQFIADHQDYDDR